MKKCVIFFVLVCLALLNGCDKKSENNEKSEKSVEDTARNTNVNMQIAADFSRELVVPNPEITENDVSIVMRYNPYGANDDEMEQCYQSCVVDLSFLGFKNKMMVLDFQIGAVTGYTSEHTHVEFDIPDDYSYGSPILQSREINGNCLVLAAKDCVDENDDNYIIVLDYGNKKSYTVKTSIWNPMDDHMPILQLCDFTGDGLMDIVISNSLNEKRVNMEVFTFSGNNLKNLYTMLEGKENTGERILGYLEDGYKVVIKHKPTGLKVKKSLLRNYSKKQLQDDGLLTEDKYPYSHVYDKNGKLKKDLGDRDIQIDLAQNMKICKRGEYDHVISYSRSVTFAKYNHVCQLNVYLKYDIEKDRMDIYKVSVRWDEPEY